MIIEDKLPQLLELGIAPQILDRYREPHRFYHTIAHLDDLIHQLHQRNLDNDPVLLLATIYHDIIYNPQSATNEEDSAQYFDETFTGQESVKSQVKQIILDTKTHQASTLLSALFCQLDLDILKRPLSDLINYERQIFKEYQFADYHLYKNKRIEVLKLLQEQINNPDLNALIAYVAHWQPHIAVYPGSFNPFHKGHMNILQKAEQIFDKVIIARGVNTQKQPPIYQFPHSINYRQCTSYQGLLTDFIANLNYPVTIIRGLRNTTDLQYELNQYRYLQDLSANSLNIISIFCDPEFEHVSSSAIRQLEEYGRASSYIIT